MKNALFCLLSCLSHSASENQLFCLLYLNWFYKFQFSVFYLFNNSFRPSSRITLPALAACPSMENNNHEPGADATSDTSPPPTSHFLQSSQSEMMTMTSGQHHHHHPLFMPVPARRSAYDVYFGGRYGPSSSSASSVQLPTSCHSLLTAAGMAGHSNIVITADSSPESAYGSAAHSASSVGYDYTWMLIIYPNWTFRKLQKQKMKQNVQKLLFVCVFGRQLLFDSP